MTDLDPYVVLGISPEAGLDEIRAAFRRAVRREHPDTASRTPEESAVGKVVDAYRLLTDPVERARYDTAHTPGTPRNLGIRVPVWGGNNAKSAEPRRSRCPDCVGTGRVAFIVVCPRCAGAGETTELDVDHARVVGCQTCRGRGKVRVSERCNSCSGSGMTSRSEE
jgi:DnaJ-class molecular chaperone